jgi:hypothetical protein
MESDKFSCQYLPRGRPSHTETHPFFDSATAPSRHSLLLLLLFRDAQFVRLIFSSTMPPLFIAEIAGESVVIAKVAYRYFRAVTVFHSLTLAVLFPLFILCGICIGNSIQSESSRTSHPVRFTGPLPRTSDIVETRRTGDFDHCLI